MSTRTISYLPSLSALSHRVRAYIVSGNPQLQTLKSDSLELNNDRCISLKSFDKDKTTELAPKPVFSGMKRVLSSPNILTIDKKFPLPSFTGVPQCHLLSSPPLDTATQFGTIDGFFEPQISTQQESSEVPKVEMLIQESPSFLLNSFMELMPGIPELKYNKLSVICISEHTNHDMSKWTYEMCQEREELTNHFINSSKEICARITEYGFWADFVDPSSGQPYLGESGSGQMTEIDDRMRHFGFSIEDLGCCKCIRHHKWGVNVFVGVILTTAPTNSTIMTSLINL